MHNKRWAFYLAVLASFIVPVSAAHGEFAAHNKSHEGSTAYVGFRLEASGVLQCFNEESGAPKWTLKNSKGELSESGTELFFKIKSWGGCEVAPKEGEQKEAKVTSGECEMEVDQPEEGEHGKGGVASCTLKIETTSKETCEVKIEGDKEQPESTIGQSGEENQNAVLTVNLSKRVSITATGSCGLKSSKEASLETETEGLQVSRKGDPAPFTTYLLAPHEYLMRGEERTLVVKWLFPAREEALPEVLTGVETPMESTPFFTVTGQTVLFCKNKTYNITQPECRMKIKMEREPARGQRYTHIFTLTASLAGMTSTDRVVGIR